jgi:hypothetical protein
MLQMLDQDPRPAFVIATTARNVLSEEGLLEYWNTAMAVANAGGLLNLVLGKTSGPGNKDEDYAHFSQFKRWYLALDGTDETFFFHGFSWLKISLDSRWNVISGVATDTCVRVKKPETNALSRKSSKTKVPSFDWTDEVPPLKLSPHVAWARSIDWASTPLGPMSNWSSQLRSIANLVMQDPRPAVLFYGPELIMIYNEAEIELLGGFHPCMGASARVALSSVWPHYFEPIIERNLAGETVEQTNSAIHMMRNGYMEETYFSLKFIPIFNAEGVTVGHYEPLVETVCPPNFILTFSAVQPQWASQIQRLL